VRERGEGEDRRGEYEREMLKILISTLLFVQLMHAIDHAIGQCLEQCHMNAQCTESGEGMATCVCLPGFTGDGLNCSGQFFNLTIYVYTF
jgi:hypothetical protein